VSTSSEQLTHPLTGKTVLVTGGGRGLGAAISRRVAAAGARVALVGRNKDRLQEVADGLPHDPLIVPADLGEPDAPLAVLDQVISVFGTLDVLVNNAGLGHVGSSDQLTPREVGQVLGLNARAALLLAGHAAGHMARSGGGSIVTISSALSNRGNPMNSLYSASKGALDAAARALAAPGDLERAQQAGQREFKQIVEALRPPKPPPPPLEPSALPPAALPAPALPPAAFPVPAPGQAAAAASEPDPPGWPKAANDQISAIQQALFDLKLLSDKPDGAIGPVTRTAIRSFQRSTGARETGEPTKDVFAALQQAIARRAAAASTPPSAPAIDLSASEPPPPPTSEDISRAAPMPQEKTDSATVEPPIAPASITQASIAQAIDLGAPEPPPAPPTSADIARAAPASEEKTDSAKVEPANAVPAPIDPPRPPMPKVEEATAAPRPTAATPEGSKPAPPESTPATAIDLGQPEPPPAPPTSADIVRADPDVWPASTADQVTAVQRLLRDLNFLRDPPDGLYGPGTRAAILDYERTAGLAQTGEPSKALFESLKETREKAMRKPN